MKITESRESRFARAKAKLEAAGKFGGGYFDWPAERHIAVVCGDEGVLREIEDSAADAELEAAHAEFEALQLRDAAAGREQRRALCDKANGIGVSK